MGIFTGIEILFYVMGALTVLLIWGLFGLMRKYSFSLPAIILAALGILGILFTLMWFFSSLIEGELQSANMGLTMFGIFSLCCFGVARQLVVKTMKGNLKEAP